MKTYLLFFILFFSISIYPFEYNANLGIKGVMPFEIEHLASTAKCIGMDGDIDYKWAIGAVFDNNFKITDFTTVSLMFTYQYSSLHITKSHQENITDTSSPYISDYDYNKFHLIKITPGIKLFFLENLYSGIGLSYDYYLNGPEELKTNKTKLALNLSVGYLINNFGIEASFETIKDFDIDVKTKAYNETAITIFYIF